jgi:hypothetical protein
MINRSQLGHNVCPVCGASVSGVEARVVDDSCPCWLCRAAHLQRTVRQIYEEKQRRTRDAARRRKEHALACRDRLAAELPITAPQELLTFALPAQQRPLVRLAENRKALFREHLERVVQEAFGGTVSPEAPSLSQTEDKANCQDGMLPILGAGCAVCQGRCCWQGGDRAYLTVDLVLRFRAQYPQATAEDVYREYDSRLGERTYEDSCIYHQEQGCGLPRALRTDICNSFECEELDELHRAARATREPMLLVALDGSRAVRWSVYSGPPDPAAR